MPLRSSPCAEIGMGRTVGRIQRDEIKVKYELIGLDPYMSLHDINKSYIPHLLPSRVSYENKH